MSSFSASIIDNENLKTLARLLKSFKLKKFLMICITDKILGKNSTEFKQTKFSLITEKQNQDIYKIIKLQSTNKKSN